MIIYFDRFGNGPFEHDCESGPQAVREWTERQKVLGLIDDKEAAVLVRCAEDLEVQGA